MKSEHYRALDIRSNGVRVVLRSEDAAALRLNLLERVWRFLKQKLACHRFWADREGLRAAATILLTRTEARLHAPDRPTIRLGPNFCQSA